MAVLEPRNFLQPCLLLLLREQADHGYELVSRLGPLHDGEGDSGGVYRALRGLERRGLVYSQWSIPQGGPARRTYRLTGAGEAFLDLQAAELRQVDDALHLFLDRYERTTAGPPGTGDVPAGGCGDDPADRRTHARTGPERAAR